MLISDRVYSFCFRNDPAPEPTRPLPPADRCLSRPGDPLSATMLMFARCCRSMAAAAAAAGGGGHATAA